MTEKLLNILEYNKILELISKRAVTSTAKEEIHSLRPVTDFDRVLELQGEMSDATAMLARRAMPPVSAIADVTGALKRSEAGGVLGAGELMAIGAVLRTAKQVKRYLEAEEDIATINDISASITVISDLERDISDAIISEEEIADSASAGLAAIRRKMRSLSGKIKDILNDMLHSEKYTKYLQEPIVTMRGDRYVLPVKSESRGSVPGILHDTSATGSTVFIEPMAVVEINNQLRALTSSEKEEIEKILAEFSVRVAEHSIEIAENFKAVIRTDIMFAKASFCVDYRCHTPELNREG